MNTLWEYHQIILGAMIGGLAAMTTTYWRVRQYQARSYAAEAIALQIQTQDVLDAVRTTTGMARALLVAMHNGGGPVLGGTAQYASVMREAHAPELASVQADFQGVELDMEYMLMLGQLEARRVVYLRTPDMRGGMLRTRYEADGITCAFIFKIEATPMRYYFVSFSTTGPEADFTSAAQYARMEGAVSRLRLLYRNAKRGGYLA